MTARIRQQLAAALAAELPAKKYRIVPGVAGVDRLAKPLIQLELSAFEPAPERGRLVAEITVHVATNRSGATAAAEDDADEIAFEVHQALARIPWANPTRAEKTLYKGEYLGYDLTTEITTRKQETP